MTGYNAVQKRVPYHHAVQKYRNTSVYSVDITPLNTHKNATIEILRRNNYNLPHTEINIHIVPTRRFTLQHFSPLPQNVQNLDVGQLELFLRCLNLKQAKRLPDLTNASRGSSPRVFPTKSVFSLVRPNFLTGAIKKLVSRPRCQPPALKLREV